ncbi:MAG: hypothetical protein U5K43_10760 [Halofilum sp. (in: g-proteobacteria)]|nr:hypothetical protein [Halofilum sp. (in: g-proteobacteria)]
MTSFDDNDGYDNNSLSGRLGLATEELGLQRRPRWPTRASTEFDNCFDRTHLAGALRVTAIPTSSRRVVGVGADAIGHESLGQHRLRVTPQHASERTRTY